MTLDGFLDVNKIKILFSQQNDLRIHYYESTDSTNRRAKESDAAGPRWELFVADQQTAGYGQQGRTWQSPPGNLALTLLARDHGIDIKDSPKISLLVGSAVARGIAHAIGEGVALKWPNDVLVDGKKVAGILLEDAPGGAIAMGVGLNVNSLLSDFPEEVREERITLREKTGRIFSREELLRDMIQAIVENITRFQGGGWMGLLADYRRLSFLSGKMVWSDRGTVAEIYGRAMGVGDQGQLLIKKEDGQAVDIFAGHISLK